MAPLYHTYSNSLHFRHEEKSFSAGFCLSHLSFDELSKTYNQFLHKEEKACFLQLQYPKRQHSYLLGRYCAKHAISRYNKLSDFTEIWIENGVFQHPVVIQAPISNIQVSISHTEGIGAALAFSEIYPMAVDIEVMSSKKADIIRSHVSSSEMNLNRFGTMEDHFIFLWTAKEALSKILKCGLTVPLGILEISFTEIKNNVAISYFKNFKQYKLISFRVDNIFCSIVYPQMLHLELDSLTLASNFGELSPKNEPLPSLSL